jgi:Zn-finger nucleic acid-binding protein
MADRQGVEIDYCPKCRGVWLDRGELDKIIERSAAAYSAPSVDTDKQFRDEDKRYYPKSDDHYQDPRYRHKKKKGFLGDLFDFD